MQLATRSVEPQTALATVISGNSSSGIYINANNTVILGNLIGTNAAGTDAIGNGTVGSATGGIHIAGRTGTTVGGSSASARNTISGNGGAGIRIEGTTSSAIIQGNYIGVDAAGDTALGNSVHGIYMLSGTITNVQIGGANAGQGNVISGNSNGSGGVYLDAGSGTVLEGNRIGVGGNHDNRVGNHSAIRHLHPIRCDQHARRRHLPRPRGNLIARNGASGGVTIQAGSTGNTIQGNSITNNTGHRHQPRKSR